MSGRNAKLCRRMASYYRRNPQHGPVSLREVKRTFRRLSQREKAKARRIFLPSHGGVR